MHDINAFEHNMFFVTLFRNRYCVFDVRTEKNSDGIRRRRNRKTSSEDGEEADTADAGCIMMIIHSTASRASDLH